MKRVSFISAQRNPALLGDIGVRIWSGEHGGWWRYLGQGYTDHIEASGFYTPAEALNYTRDLGPEKKITFEVAQDLGIPFSAPMIHGLLAERKHMTRRMAWSTRKCSQCKGSSYVGARPEACTNCSGAGFIRKSTIWRKVRPGDRLWVRENFRVGRGYDDLSPIELPKPEQTPIKLWYEATLELNSERSGKLRPAMFMPRWMSRITLTVTATKAERIQKIDNIDAKLEGITRCSNGRDWYDGTDITTASSTARGAFYCLWLKLHGKKAWDANPEVVALTFTVAKQNIDALKVAA